MIKKFRLLRDRLSIWAILRFNFKLPDLQQAESVKPGRVYYYYGRWVRLVSQPTEVKGFINALFEDQGVTDVVPDSLGEIIAEKVCPFCALHRLGLPCRKFQGGTVRDLCFKYRYQLVKGKKYDEKIESE